MEFFLFFLFVSLCLVSSFCVVFVSNAVFSAFFLVLSFLNAAGFLLLFGLDYLCFLFLLVYIGAIAILFIFVIMLLNLSPLMAFYRNKLFFFPVGVIYGGIVWGFFYFLFYFLFYFEKPTFFCIDYIEWVHVVDHLNLIYLIGQVLYTDFSIWFLLAGIVLLISLLGSIVLTLQIEEDIFFRKQFAFQQLCKQTKLINFYL